MFPSNVFDGKSNISRKQPYRIASFEEKKGFDPNFTLSKFRHLSNFEKSRS